MNTASVEFDDCFECCLHFCRQRCVGGEACSGCSVLVEIYRRIEEAGLVQQVQLSDIVRDLPFERFIQSCQAKLGDQR